MNTAYFKLQTSNFFWWNQND